MRMRQVALQLLYKTSKSAELASNLLYILQRWNEMLKNILVALLFAIGTNCQADKAIPGGKAKPYEIKTELVKALLENYNPEIIPAPTSLKFGVALVSTNLIEEESSLDSNLWLRMVWTDPRLKWDEDKFPVSVLRIDPSNVWIPDVQLYNARDSRYGDIASSCIKTKVSIYPNGEVLWVPPCRFFSICANSTDTVDQKTCLMKFGSWTYDGLLLDFNFYNDQPYMDLSDFFDITEWTLLSAKGKRTSKTYDCCKEPYIDILYNVTLQRKPERI